MVWPYTVCAERREKGSLALSDNNIYLSSRLGKSWKFLPTDVDKSFVVSFPFPRDLLKDSLAVH